MYFLGPLNVTFTYATLYIKYLVSLSTPQTHYHPYHTVPKTTRHNGRSRSRSQMINTLVAHKEAITRFHLKMNADFRKSVLSLVSRMQAANSSFASILPGEKLLDTITCFESDMFSLCFVRAGGQDVCLLLCSFALLFVWLLFFIFLPSFVCSFVSAFVWCLFWLSVGARVKG